MTLSVCLTVDVEWAHPAVLADLVGLLDERGLRATFFCTHAGVDVPGHERGIHPNFRGDGETLSAIRKKAGRAFETMPPAEVYRRALKTTMAFCPEAAGVRGHSLFYDSLLLSLYAEAGLEYDCTYFLPLVEGLKPFSKEYGILEIPTYYIDHFDLKTGTTGFALENLKLGRPGLKVFDFHPNMVYLNARTDADYQACRPFYHDPDRLLKSRRRGKGVRTLFLDLLDHLAARKAPTATVGELARR